MKQNWNRVLFAHWPIDPEIIRPHIPGSLILDTYDGQAWIGFIFFQVSDMRMRYLPTVPFTAKYYELNVRTYVTCEDKPGVYFLSLDAANYLAVNAAKAFFHLPYHYSRISVKKEDGRIDCDCRGAGSEKEFRFKGWYRPKSEVFQAEPGSLAYWLTERYCLYTEYNRSLYRGDMLHEPWPLQQAEGEITENTMVDFETFPPSEKPLLHYADRQEALAWRLHHVRKGP